MKDFGFVLFACGALGAFAADSLMPPEAFALRLQEFGLIDRTLREFSRTRLRTHYASHPGAMEPAPCHAPLNFGLKERIMKLESITVSECSG